MNSRFHWLVVIAFNIALIAALWLLPSSQAQEDSTPAPFPTATPSLFVTPLPAFPSATPNLQPSAPTTIPNVTPSPTIEAPQVLQQTCLAEPKWTLLVEVRRGPSNNWGVIGYMVHNPKEVQEARVIGRTADNNWYQVILPAPNQDKAGWVWHEHMAIFGACQALPVTDSTPELAPDAFPPAPSTVAIPLFAQGLVQLTEQDRAWLVNEGMIYIRRDIPGAEQRDRLQAHVLVMNLNDPRLDVRVTIGAVPGVEAVQTSQMAASQGALAAINGDFYAGNYFPQGLTVIDGEVVTAPKLRATFGITQDRHPFIGYFTNGWTWPATVTAENGAVIPLQLMNVPCDAAWLCMYTYHRANRLPEGVEGVRAVLDENFIVVEMRDSGGVDLPEGYSVLVGGKESPTGRWLRDNVKVGDKLQIDRPTTPNWEDFSYVISGGPRLLTDGEFWNDCYPDPIEGQPCEEFDAKFRESHYGLKSLPRTAVGYNVQGLIYAVMVEGYEVGDSGGATREELADIFLDFGATEAMQFDGGGSSTFYMLPNGLISDHGIEGERRVTNALLFFWNEQ